MLITNKSIPADISTNQLTKEGPAVKALPENLKPDQPEKVSNSSKDAFK